MLLRGIGVSARYRRSPSLLFGGPTDESENAAQAKHRSRGLGMEGGNETSVPEVRCAHTTASGFLRFVQSVYRARAEGVDMDAISWGSRLSGLSAGSHALRAFSQPHCTTLGGDPLELDVAQGMSTFGVNRLGRSEQFPSIRKDAADFVRRLFEQGGGERRVSTLRRLFVHPFEARAGENSDAPIGIAAASRRNFSRVAKNRFDQRFDSARPAAFSGS